MAAVKGVEETTVELRPTPKLAVEVTKPVVAEAEAETEPEAVADLVAVEEEAELDEPTFLQDRSNRGVVLEVLLEIPKLGLAPASASMYHQVLVSPKRGQPTWSQYCLALAREATASPSVGPLTGQPVSVIHTSLPLATALVLATASSKRALPWSMPLAMVVWK